MPDNPLIISHIEKTDLAQLFKAASHRLRPPIVMAMPPEHIGIIAVTESLNGCLCWSSNLCGILSHKPWWSG
jgi:hypothetical protein